jgi:hypothetical protein
LSKNPEGLKSCGGVSQQLQKSFGSPRTSSPLRGCSGYDAGRLRVDALLHNEETLDHLSTACAQLTILRMYLRLLAQVAFHPGLPAEAAPAIVR